MCLNLNNNVFYKHRVITGLCICLLIFLPVDFIAGYLQYKWLHRKQTSSTIDTPALRWPNPYFHHGLSSNFEGEDKWGDHSYSIVTNSLGFKDKEVRTIDPYTDAYRMVFIGDSFTEGIGIPFEKTFVGRISEYYANQDIEVLNAAAVSYSPKLFYFKIKYLVEIEKLKIDELHVFMDVSDVADEIIYGNFIPKNSSDGELLPEVKTYVPNRGRLPLYEYSLLYRTWSKMWLNEDPWTRVIYIQRKTGKKINYYGERTAWLFNKTLYEEWGKDGFESCEYYMEKLFKLGEKYNFSVILVVYPWPSEIVNNAEHSLNVRLWNDFSERVGIKFINLYSLFINETNSDFIYKKYFIKDDIHWNESGHEEVAKWWIKSRASEKINLN